MSRTSITSSVSHRGILALCHLTACAARLLELGSAMAAYPRREPPTFLSFESLLYVSLPPDSGPSESLSSVFSLSVLPRGASVPSVVPPLLKPSELWCLPVAFLGPRRLSARGRGHHRPYHAPSGTV
ncbi:hypothetical protein E2C01_089357 [Portunus trituberculatus]|uniref:Secreted protein n=1 Tax=Portunus trituberculatus TaxID=210409 RepID=A0A5B7JBQ2_PORTR|nr:hypothetical protein [Portunus trituberculatus]